MTTFGRDTSAEGAQRHSFAVISFQREPTYKYRLEALSVGNQMYFVETQNPSSGITALVTMLAQRGGRAPFYPQLEAVIIEGKGVPDLEGLLTAVSMEFPHTPRVLITSSPTSQQFLVQGYVDAAVENPNVDLVPTLYSIKSGRLEWERTICQISEDIMHAKTPEALSKALESITKKVGAAHYSLFVRSNGDSMPVLEGFSFKNPFIEDPAGVFNHDGSSLMSVVLSSKEPLWIGPNKQVRYCGLSSRDERIQTLLGQSKPGYAPYSSIIVPLIGKDGTEYGIMTVMSPEEFSIGQFTMMRRYATHLASRMNVEQLRQTVEYDPMTPGYFRKDIGHRKLEYAFRLYAEGRGKRQAKVPFCLIYADINYMHGIDSGCGHEIGDMVITAVSGRIASVFKSDVIKARDGGDEFYLAIEVQPEALQDRLTRLVSQFNTYPIALDFGEKSYHIPVNVSFGILAVTCSPLSEQNVKDVFSDVWNNRDTVVQEAKTGRTSREEMVGWYRTLMTLQTTSDESLTHLRTFPKPTPVLIKELHYK
ncbi:diguanylate cyclase [Candidatus Woesearchaeota archaeon]|nr:diguanylate cyclase [Candidatus Woesearchaeota archaeon]